MHETASKFLFDHNSQGNLKFEEPMSFSPFNTRFSQNNLDFFLKLNASNMDDNSIFNNNKSMNSIKPFSNICMEKASKSKAEDMGPTLLNFKETPVLSNKSTPAENRPKNIILQASESSGQKKKKCKKKTSEPLIKEDDEKNSKILKHPISKLRKSKQPTHKTYQDQDDIYIRFYPHDLTTKSLMMKLNNFPRLEIKTSKKNYLKKIVDHLREKWLSKLNSQKDFKFDVIIKPNKQEWLRHLDPISSKLNLPSEDDCTLSENYMLSDVWSGYNEPASHKIDLFYEIKEVKKTKEDGPSEPAMPQVIKKENFPQRAYTFAGLQGIQPNKEPASSNNNKNDKMEKADNMIAEHPGAERVNPYAGTEYFDTMRRSASLSRNSDKSNEAKSNGSSGFSFNDTASKDPNMRGNARLNGMNDQSLRILYSQLNQQFPDDSKFTSQLSKTGQVLNNVGTIKQIPVKRKT